MNAVVTYFGMDGNQLRQAVMPFFHGQIELNLSAVACLAQEPIGSITVSIPRSNPTHGAPGHRCDSVCQAARLVKLDAMRKELGE